MIAPFVFASMLASEIHPIFSSSAAAIERAYEKGRSEARRKLRLEDVAMRWTVGFAGQAMPSKENSALTSFAVFLPDLAAAELDGFADQKQGRPMAARPTVKESERRLRIQVHLVAWPRTTGVADYDADERDVTDVKFLLVDREDSIAPAVEPVRTWSGAVRSTAVSPAGDDCRFWVPLRRKDEEFGTAAGIFSMFPQASSGDTTVTKTGFAANYEVEFPLYHWGGLPLFGSQTETLTLVVIYPHGRHRAWIRLNDLLRRARD